jgi:uracil-DNA glycosylase
MSDLINLIASIEMPNVFNPWRHDDPLDVAPLGHVARLERLRQHFDHTPKYLLIGEAPGYQGCHFSGVPFTHEKMLLDGTVPRVECDRRITTRERPWCEPSATIVWGTLHKLGIAADVVMWNAFAWHPHKPGEPMSNRTPTLTELYAGREILAAVVRRFASATLIAVGNKSRDLLCNLGYWHAKHVRHPSMGGANEFREGMAALTAAKATP